MSRGGLLCAVSHGAMLDYLQGGRIVTAKNNSEVEGFEVNKEKYLFDGELATIAVASCL